MNVVGSGAQMILGVAMTPSTKLRLRGTGWPFTIHARIEAMLRNGWEARRTGNQCDLIKIPTGGDLNTSDLVLTVLQHLGTSCEARRANETDDPDLTITRRMRVRGSELRGHKNGHQRKAGEHTVFHRQYRPKTGSGGLNSRDGSKIRCQITCLIRG